MWSYEVPQFRTRCFKCPLALRYVVTQPEGGYLRSGWEASGGKRSSSAEAFSPRKRSHREHHLNLYEYDHNGIEFWRVTLWQIILTKCIIYVCIPEGVFLLCCFR